MLFDCRRTPLTRTSCASVPSVQLDMGNIFKHYNVLEAEKYSLTLMHKAPDAPLGPHGKVRRRGAAVGVVSRPAAGAASAVVRWFFFFVAPFWFRIGAHGFLLTPPRYSCKWSPWRFTPSS